MFDSFGDRMKSYEAVTDITLERKKPVILRIDGKAFHTLTKGFVKPYDSMFCLAMAETAKRLCENIQGAELAYTQSDEITILIQDYENENTDAWFGYRIQKLCSVTASMATLYFNEIFNKLYLEELAEKCGDVNEYDLAYDRARRKGALFDARVYNVPFDEVFNVFKWRQVDCHRNAILGLGQHYLGHKQTINKSCKELEEEINVISPINKWPRVFLWGTCVIKDDEDKWFIDRNLPCFEWNNAYNILKKYTFNG